MMSTLSFKSKEVECHTSHFASVMTACLEQVEHKCSTSCVTKSKVGDVRVSDFP